MKIVVFGANGPTGRHLTKQALEAGHDVTAFTRHPDAFPIAHPALDVVGGDVHDLATVKPAVKGRDVVLSTLGVAFSRQPVTVYSQGMANVMAAMRHAGLSRVVCVTSSAVASHPEPLGGFVFTRIVQPYVVNVLGRTLYDDMRRMEEAVMESDLDWTIIRPSGLFETATVTPYELAEDHIAGRFTSRADLADCLLRQGTEARHHHNVLAIATVAVTPSMVKLIWREGIRKKNAA